MTITEIPTEQTTGVTDIILAATALFVLIVVYRTGQPFDRNKTRLWAWAFGLLTIASLFGAAAHGFKMTEHMNFILWQPINLALGLTVALFAAGVVYDLKGASLPRMLVPAFLATGAIFYIITLLVPGTFFVFILYETIAMLFALVSYLIMAIRYRGNGYWLMTTGILLSIIAAGIQATNSIRITFIWEFDHNGIFHIIQAVGLVFLLSGLRRGFLAPHRA